jgi:TolB-like protein/class 3 adenylate cyclase
MREDRRLAAIMFTDIVGYTKLMGTDEDQAFKILSINREIHNTFLARHNGTLIKEMGDGILASFYTASDAVRCAIEIQQESKTENIKLRIGIHEGEMVFAGDDVLGDGVNVASRLEELAEEGCINISGAVYKDVKNKTGISAKFIEEKTLKNIDEPVKVYRVWCQQGKEEKKEDKSAGKDKNKTTYYLLASITIIIIATIFVLYYMPKQRINQYSLENLAEKPISIAVLPFNNLSGDPDQDFMCDGLTEEIIHYLSVIKEFDKVISRSSVMTFKDSDKTIPEIASLLNVNFILEGSYRQSGDRLRITAQLIEASNDNHLWTEIYEQPMGDIFDIQSDIAKKIASNLKGELSVGENEQLKKKPTDNLEAYNLYLKGRHFWHQRTEEDLKKSVYYFNLAIQLDSTYTLAYAGLADTYYIMAWWGWYPAHDGYSKAKDYALKALSVDNSALEVHVTLGGISAYHDYNWEDAEKKFKLAISLIPKYATAYQEYSELLDILKRNEEAREQINISLKLNPHSYIMNHLSAILYYHNADYKKAIEWSEKALAISTNNVPMLLILKCYVKLGMNNEAVEHIRNIISVDASSNNYELVNKMYQKSGIEGVIYWFINWILLNESKENFMISNYWIASLYAIIGDSGKAVEYLEKGFDLREGNLPKINNNPDFEILKTDPKFTALLTKMQLL